MTPNIIIHTYKTMYQQEQKLQNMHQNSLFYQLPKKLIQLAISFALLSLVFFHPSLQPFFHSSISNISTFSSQLFSLATDKNYIFLLCNGILVFIAKYSSHSVDTCKSHQTEVNHDNDELITNSYRNSMQSSLIERSTMVESVSDNKDEFENESQENVVMVEDRAEDKYVVYQITDGTEMEDHDNHDHDHDDQDDDGLEKNEFHGWYCEEKVEEENEEVEEEMEEEEQEEEIAKMSTEELNRKFDDFIRKMKEELRIEAQRQLIVV